MQKGQSMKAGDKLFCLVAFSGERIGSSESTEGDESTYFLVTEKNLSHIESLIRGGCLQELSHSGAEKKEESFKSKKKGIKS